MRKILLLFLSIIITAFLAIGCTTSKNLTISMKQHELNGMGMTYLISNLEKGT